MITIDSISRVLGQEIRAGFAWPGGTTFLLNPRKNYGDVWLEEIPLKTCATTGRCTSEDVDYEKD